MFDCDPAFNLYLKSYHDHVKILSDENLQEEWIKLEKISHDGNPLTVAQYHIIDAERVRRHIKSDHP